MSWLTPSRTIDDEEGEAHAGEQSSVVARRATSSDGSVQDDVNEYDDVEDIGDGQAVHQRPLAARSRRSYRIAWICALPIEMAAARAMLDTVHDLLPISPRDTNTYLLGRIGRHNVVVTCLPGLYGTINAASVASHLKRTFPCIDCTLMVGIGGGASSMADLRLGDVVVGMRVMQYDMGKVVRDGPIEYHELKSSRIVEILQEKMGRYRAFDRPNLPDRLFQATYDHDPELLSCDFCDSSRLVPRRPRSSNEPVIHYGAIASGNIVMKHGRTRDEIARRFDVKCFEMEAAGLMDIIPCLPIRGICDYSDSHKNKTGRAIKRDKENEIEERRKREKENEIEERRKRLLEALAFDQVDARKGGIGATYASTCRWFLEHSDYQAWLNTAQHVEHYGLLWIKGKPGAGKSTLMKFLYSKVTKDDVRDKTLTVSFFFNARGQHLEKTVLGMYRSLLLQILTGLPHLQDLINDTDLVPSHISGCPPLNSLKDLLRAAVCALGNCSLTCFVDALDECDEQQVEDIVRFFEDLADHAIREKIPLRICFSSRHYPYIHVRWGKEITLEEQPGHGEDLASYVGSRLVVSNSNVLEELKSQILQKAAGVFLWVVLVVEILNKENRYGGLALRKRLAEIPNNLSQLFKDVLRRDTENTGHLLLCVLWIICAERPLRPQEFYHALWIGLAIDGQVDTELPDIDAPESTETISRLVISSSRGLAEITKSSNPVVQFIHESVRDFFIREKGLEELWPEVGFDWQSPTNDRIKKCCYAYLCYVWYGPESLMRFRPGSNPYQWIDDPALVHNKGVPLLGYAYHYTLRHASKAASAFDQLQFLDNFPVEAWIITGRQFDYMRNEAIDPKRPYSPDADLNYILCEQGLTELVRARLAQDIWPFEYSNEKHRHPVYAAFVKRHGDVVSALVKAIGEVDCVDNKLHLRTFQGRTLLSYACRDGQVGMTRMLLENDADVDWRDIAGRTPLSLAAETGSDSIIRLLLEHKAKINAADNTGITPLMFGAWYDSELAVLTLLEAGADINMRDHDGQTALMLALWSSRKTAVNLLLEKGAECDKSDNLGRTPLIIAIRAGAQTALQPLLAKVVDVEAVDGDGCTPLIAALLAGFQPAIDILLEHGVNVNARDCRGNAPLLVAIRSPARTAQTVGINEEKLATANVERLLTNGADITATDHRGQSSLILAAQLGWCDLTMQLLRHGPDVDQQDNLGKTALDWAKQRDHEDVCKILLSHLGGERREEEVH